MALNPFDAALEEMDAEQRAPAPNPFAQTLKDLDGDRETQLRGAMTVAQDTTPDRRAEAMRLGQRLGLPVAVVERNFDDIKKRATVADTPYSQMMRESPTLAGWLEQPDHAAVAHDDLEQLGALEWLMTAPQRAVAQGINQVRFGQLKTESMFRDLTREEQDLLGSYRTHMELGGELGAGGAWWRKAVTGAGQLLPNIAGGSAMAIKYGTAGALATGAIGAVGGVAGAAAGAGIGFRAGGLYGAGKFGFQLEAGLALDEYEKFTDETGRPIDRDVARGAALATGLMNAGLEAYGLTKLAQSIPGVNKLTGAAFRAGVKEALKRPTVRAGLAAAMKNYAGTLTAETATEVAQRAATILSGEVAKFVSGQDIKGRSGPDIFADLINEGVGAIQSFGLTVLPGPAMQVAHARAQAQAAARNVEFFRDMGTGMAASKAAQRAPGALQDLAARAFDAGPIRDVYAPLDTWVTYWQEKGQDPAEMAAEVTGNPRALIEAEEQGGLVKIPTAAYAVKLAPTDHNEFFASELKMAPDEMNTREALAFQEAEVAQADAQRAEADRQEQAQLTPTQQIEQQLTERLVGAQIPQQTAAGLAQYVSAAVGKLSTDAGFDPVEVFTGYGFHVERQTSSAAPGPTAVIEEPGGEPAAVAQELPLDTVPAQVGQAVATETLDPDAVAGQQQVEAQPLPPVDTAPGTGDTAVDAGLDSGAGAGAHAGGRDTPRGVSESRPGRRENDVTSIIRRKPGESLRQLAARRHAHVQEAHDARKAAHLDGLFLDVLASAQAIDPQVNPAELRAEFDFRIEFYLDQVSLYLDSGQDPVDLLRAIAAAGGIGAESAGGLSGERRWLMEGATAGQLRGIQVFRTRALDARGQPTIGVGFDVMVQRLQEDPRFQWIVDPATLIDAIDDAVRHEALFAPGVYPGSDQLGSDLAMPPDQAWWRDPWRAQQAETVEETAAEDQDAEVSFEPSEFEQSVMGLFDAIDKPLPKTIGVAFNGTITEVDSFETAGRQFDQVRDAFETAVGPGARDEFPGAQVVDLETGQPFARISWNGRIWRLDDGSEIERNDGRGYGKAPAIDVLSTGEQQPRLPGAENVREQNIATPQFEAPFALQPETAKGKKGKQVTLFQGPAQEPGEANAAGERAVFIGWQEGFGKVPSMPLYNVMGGEKDRSTVTAEELEARGIPVPETPAKPDEFYQPLFHGSPHDFLRFDLSKIGTGEGAQVYGHGLYFAENPEVAESYRTAGLPGFLQYDITPKARRLWAEQYPAGVGTFGKLHNVALQHAAEYVKQNSGIGEMVRQAMSPELIAALEASTPITAGRLYQVDIPDEQIAKMLDWDKPLSEQSEHVRQVFERARDQGGYLGTFTERSPSFGAMASPRYTGRDVVRALERQLGRAELVSERLKHEGIPGIVYLDQGSRVEGKGTRNVVAFDDSIITLTHKDGSPVTEQERTEFFQGKPAEPKLVAHHNLTAANLLHMAKMGGLAVPSLAITRSDQTITGFGEITLLGSAALADPKTGMQVFGADIYSPRYPTIHYKIPAAGEKKLGDLVAKHAATTGQRYIDLDSLQKEGARHVRQIGAVLVEFLEAHGIPRPAPSLNQSKYARPGDVDQFQTRYALEQIIRERNLETEFDAYAEALFVSLKPTEHIFKGFTNAGNRSYTPHTLENVVAIVKKELRGGESSSNLYGMGQLRAKFTPRFRSVEAIRKAKGLLVSKESFEAIKEELETEFFGIANSLKGRYEHDAETFRFSDTVLAVMEDAPRKGLTWALKEYGFTDVPADTQAAIGDFLSKLRTLPTEYFEAKALRSVGLDEFAGAVIPEGTSAEVLKLLSDNGIPAAVYKKGDDADRRRAVQELAEQLGDRVLFQDTGGGNKRGSIVFGPDRSVTINLFEHADLSTFIHESGHFFLELYGDLVDRLAGLPPEQLTGSQRRLMADYGTLLKTLGVENRRDIAREQHERFARMFETYIGEGRAPSLALQEVFSRMRAWILGVYRSLRALNANLTPEVRTVFDRMLATDEQIAAAEARGRFEPLFTTAESAGMVPAAFELYRTTVEDASRRAREQLDAKLQGEVRREQETAWQEERATIRATVAEQAYGAPVYRALAAIRTGTNPDGSPLVEGMDMPPLKLSRQAIVDRYGADRLKRLPRPYVYAVTGGVDPELIAERFGFSSGDELLAAIEQAKPMEAAIDRETDRVMIERHGSMLLDGTVADAAQLAAANTVRDGVLRAELRALWALANKVKPFVQQATRAGQDALRDAQKERDYERRWLEAETKLRIAIAEGRKQSEIDALEQAIADLKAQTRGGAATIRAGLPSAVVLQQTARARIARTRVKDLTPAVFWAASRRAAAKAIEHAARQEFDEAIAAKTAELLNVTLYREAERATEDAAARVARARDLGKPKSRARIGLAGSTFLEQIDGILDRYNFAKISQKDLAKRARMRDWIEAMEAQGLPVDDLPAEVLDDLRRADYQTIPYEELVGITDGLAMIVHLAQVQNRKLKTASDEAFTETRDALRQSILDRNVLHPLAFEPGVLKHKIARAYASHLKIATLARMIDGGTDGGLMWEHIIRPVNEAADLEQSRRTDEGGRMAALLNAHYPGREMGRLKDKVHIPAIGGSLSKEARIAVMLTRGNEDGLARLLADPTRRWTQAGIDAIASTLDANDLAFINGMWAHLERFWPEIAAKQKRLTGLEPEKVEAQPFTVRSSDGVEVALTGGYYPLMYDERLSPRAARNVAVTDAKLASAAAYVSATTRRGHVKARVSNVRLSVRLDLGVAFQHADQVIHDLTHHEMLIDVARLLRDQKVAEAIYDTRGPAVYRQFTQAVSAIAVGTAPESDSDKWATFMRTGAQVAGLGYNLWTGLQQPLGLFNGMERVGVKWVARGMRRFFAGADSMQDTLAWIVASSPMMAERSNTATQDILQLREQFAKAGGWFDNFIRTVTADTLTQQHLLDSFLWHIGLMQRVADVPTWLGAYLKAMDDPANTADETRAFRLADQAVIDSQGSGHIKDLADVQRGGGMAKLWLTFYSYGSTTINRAAAIADRGSRTPNSIATMLGHYLLLYVAPAAATIALANAVGKRDDEEPEGWMGAIAAETLSGALNGVVLLRELSGAITGGTRGYEGPAGARLLELLSDSIQQVRQGEADDALFRAINATAGVVFRYPAGQVQRTVDGFVALQEGRTNNPAALLFGAPRK